MTSVTGTVCPCMTWRDADRPSYSAEWHSLNPLADNCNKTGLIDTTTTTVAIKAMFIAAGLMANMSMLSKEALTLIGELQNDDLVMYGAVNASSGEFYDVSGLSEYNDKITYNSIDYIVRHHYNADFDANVGQVAVLKRIG